MKSPYGVLPNPKFDTRQQRYRHLVDPFGCAWAIPATVTDVDKVDACLTWWAYLSTDTLVEAFYETTIKNKRLDAPDDAEMLDIFRSSICYEITTIANLDIMSILSSSTQGAGLMSSFKKKEKSLTRQLDKLVQKYTKLQ